MSQNVPYWATPEYIDECEKDVELQENWEPTVGDWYYCMDLNQVKLITTLGNYYGDSTVPLATDSGKDDDGYWLCDTYLPEPKA